MSDIILIGKNLEVVVTGAHAFTKVNLFNFILELRGKTKKTANTLFFFIFIISMLFVSDLMKKLIYHFKLEILPLDFYGRISIL